MRVDFDRLRLAFPRLCFREIEVGAAFPDSFLNVICHPRLGEGDDDGGIVTIAERVGVTDDATQFFFALGVLGKKNVLSHDVGINQDALNDF